MLFDAGGFRFADFVMHSKVPVREAEKRIHSELYYTEWGLNQAIHCIHDRFLVFFLHINTLQLVGLELDLLLEDMCGFFCGFKTEKKNLSW